MKITSFINCAFISVLIVSNVFSLQSIHPGRYKREELPWIWTDEDIKETRANYKLGSGHSTRTTETSTTSTTSSTRTTDFSTSTQPSITTKKSTISSTPNPCDIVEPSTPDFRAPGRRISEAKCYEYIWIRKNRDDKKERNHQCFLHQLRENGLDYPSFTIGGRVALPGEFPHMGGIGWRMREGTWVFKCGCSLISSKYALTAAHCSRATFDTSLLNSVPEIVRLGDKNIIDVYDQEKKIGPKDAKILKIIVHPDYKSPKKYYDIALLELEKITYFTNNVQPACLWTKFNTSELGTSATVTGWGVVETATKTTSPELQAAVVDILDTDKCDALLQPWCSRNWCGVQDNQLCAGKLAGGVDACQGDSGGPLQVKIPLPIPEEGSMHYIIGVTSFGIGCARPNLPGIYTRVSSFIDWIESIVWPEN